MSSCVSLFSVSFSCKLANSFFSVYTVRLAFPVFFLFITGCSSPQENTGIDLQKAKVISARNFVPYTGSISPPEIFPAGQPYKVKIGQKKEFPGTLNSRLAGEPKRIKVMSPVVNTPGQRGFLMPVPVKAEVNPVICQAPEVVLVKDSYSSMTNPGNFSSYSKLQGLRHDQVRGLIQDRSGNLWLATDDGAIRYDGKHFSRYSTDQGLTNDLILSVFQDSNENIWFGTYGGGISKYDGRHLYNYTVNEGLANNIVNCIFEDTKGNLWFGTGGGVSKSDGTFFTNYTVTEGLCHNDIRSIIEDDSGKIWIGSSGGGVSVFDGKTFSNYSVSQGFVHSKINSLYKDSHGNIWIGFSFNGVLKYDGLSYFWYSTNEGLGDSSVTTIIEDSIGDMWFGSMEAGLSRFDGKYFTCFSAKEGLGADFIRCALKDKNGVLWFGTRGGGIARYNGNLFTHLTSTEGLSNSRVMAILKDKSESLWLGTFGGYLTKCSFRNEDGLKRKVYTYFDERDGLLNNRVYCIMQDKKGNIWIGTDGGGVSMYDGKEMTTYTIKQGLGGSVIRKIYEDRDSNLWFASYGSGVSKFDGENFTNYGVEQGLSGNNILSILQDSGGNFWFGTDTGGVTFFDGKSFTHYSKSEGFFSNLVYSIIQDKSGLIWFGTGGSGIVKFDGKYFTAYTNETAPNNNYILSLLQDSKGNIWMGTRFGIMVLEDRQAPSFRSYDYEDGFTGIGCNIGAIAETGDGLIWIGTNDRLTIFNPEGDKISIVEPELQITGIQLFNEKIPWTELEGKNDSTLLLHNGVKVGKLRFDGLSKWYGIPVNLSLRYDNNYITISFIGISVTENSKIEYQYKLEGLDVDWNTPTTRTEATYGNLNQGDYVFVLRSKSSSGSWSNEVRYRFSIRAPWYETTWFYSVVFLFMIILIYSIFRYRLRKLNFDKQLLELKVQEQTLEISRKNSELQKTNAEKDKFFSIIAHDLRSPFSGFIGLSEQLADDLSGFTTAEIQKTAESLKGSATNIYCLLENLLDWAKMQQGQILYNPQRLQLCLIINESIISLLDVAKNKKIEIVINVHELLFVKADNYMLQTIIRNLVSNAVKFTPEKGRIVLSAMSSSNGFTEISVSDSGIGMNPSMLEKMFRIEEKINRKGTKGEPSTGLGLILCKEFVEIHSGSIRVESKEGQGSVFYFTIPSTSM
jgi:ligand-binding sensor domain-containing protein/signal transduction histidine kinase